MRFFTLMAWAAASLPLLNTVIAAPIDTDVGQIDRSLEPTDDPRAQTSKIFEYSPEGLLIPEAVSDGATDGEYHSRDIHPSYADVWNDELEVAVPIMIPEANSEAIDDSPTHDYFHPELNATIRIQIPTAIPPPHLRKRAPPPAGPLYGETGGPVMNDIRQTTIPNCGLLSAIAAVLHTNSAWLTDIITSDEDYKTTRTATFSPSNNNSLIQNQQRVDKTTLPGNRGDRGAVWWTGGLEEAIRLGGQELQMLPSHGISIVTGSRATHVFLKKDYPTMSSAVDKNGMWELMKRAGSTPIVFQTKGETKIVVKNHAYAVTGTSEEGGVKRVTMFNPWGSSATYDLDRLWEDAYLLHHLNNFASGPQGRDNRVSAPNTGGDKKPVVANERPRPQPAPSPTERPKTNAAGARIVYETRVVTKIVVVSG